MCGIGARRAYRTCLVGWLAGCGVCVGVRTRREGGGWKGFERLLMLVGLGWGVGFCLVWFGLVWRKGGEGRGVRRNQSLMEVSKCRVDLMGCGGAGWLWLEK